MRKIDQLLSEYGASHQNKLNKAIHWICVPLIFFSIVGLIWSIPSVMLRDVTGIQSSYMNWATILLIIVVLYYVSLSKSLWIGMVVFSWLCMVAANWISNTFSMSLWMLSIIIFVVAWIFQFYGHNVEGKKPSFLKDVQFLLIGPAWLMHFVYKKLNIPF